VEAGMKRGFLIVLIIMTLTLLLMACSEKAVNSNNDVPVKAGTKKVIEVTVGTDKKALYAENADKEECYKILEASVDKNDGMPRVMCAYQTEQGTVWSEDISGATVIGEVNEIRGNYLVIKTFGGIPVKYIVNKDLISNQ
jgi:hypothetical protein